MLLGSPPDMVHRAPAHGAHIRMQNSAIYSPVRFKYYTIPFGKLQVAVGGWGRKFLLKRFELKNPIKKFPLHRFRAMHIHVLHHQHRIHLFAAERCHYQTSVDTSAAATADSWSDYEVEKA